MGMTILHLTDWSDEMGNGYTASNALGVGCRAEGELIGLALRYELVRGVRLNWRKDREQTLRAVSDSMNDRDGELRSRARRFWDSLSAGERQAIHAGLPSEERGQAPIAATLVPLTAGRVEKSDKHDSSGVSYGGDQASNA